MTDRTTLVSRLTAFLLVRRYEAGDRVPSERELAERFAVSRGQVREALSYLQALRVIERRPKSGVYMATGDSSAEALALFAQLALPLTASDVQQSVELRRIHEIAAIRLACERRTETNLARLREILAAEGVCVAAGESMAEHDRLFHGEIVRATQNGVFARIVDIFQIMTSAQRALYFSKAQHGRRSHDEHSRMCDAIERRAGETAADLMSAHLMAVDHYWQQLIAHEDGRAPVSLGAGG